MELLRPEEVAAILKLSVHTVRKMLRKGMLPGIKVAGGHQWRVRKEDLDAYVHEQQKISLEGRSH